MKKSMPLESHGDCEKPMKYVEIRLKSMPRPRYMTSRLIVYGKDVSKARLESILRKKLKCVRL